MAANTVPTFTATPFQQQVQMSVANANLNGLGQLYVACQAGVNGTTIENIHFHHITTSAAGMYRIFLNDGTHTYLIHEIPVVAITVSAIVAGFEADWSPPSTLWVLPSGWSVLVSINNAETANVLVTGGNF